MGHDNYSIISLFTGGMGLDLGLEQAGFRTRVAIEINEAAIKTVKTNKPDLPIICFPIQTVSTKEILKKAGLSRGEATLVTGGPCCQSFSTAGKRGSVCDPRGILFEDYCRVISEAKPRFFIMENVKGLLSAAIKHRPLNERGHGSPPLAPQEELGSAFKVILSELRSLGYYVIYGLLNAADYGTPQNRQRIVIIGSRDGEKIALPKTTHSRDGKNGKQKWATLKEAIAPIKSREWSEFSDKQLFYLKLLGPGQNWTALPENIQPKALGGAYYSWGGRSGFYRRLSWDKPSPSLTTQPKGKATMLCHPSEDRPLSVEEYARIQGFPYNFVFSGNINDKYTLIGNAVPLRLGLAIGKMLMTTIKDTDKNGLPKDAVKKLSQIICADPLLKNRLRKQPKTQLPPSRFRSNPDPEAAKRWLSRSRRSLKLDHVTRICLP